MFGKKKTDAEKQERKARKFLSKKFQSATQGAKVVTGVMAGLAVPMAFIDGGLTMVAIMGGGMGALFTGAGLASDMTDGRENYIRKTTAGQRLYGPEWAHSFYSDVQNKLIETCDKIKYLPPGDKKKLRKLETRKVKLLDVANDLSAYLKVADKNDVPTGDPLLIMTAYAVKDKEKNAENTVDVTTGTSVQRQKSKGFDL